MYVYRDKHRDIDTNEQRNTYASMSIYVCTDTHLYTDINIDTDTDRDVAADMHADTYIYI